MKLNLAKEVVMTARLISIIEFSLEQLANQRKQEKNN